MATTYELTREVLDGMLVKFGEPKIVLGCATHPKSGVTAVYQYGCLRLLCRECGFTASVVKVALAGGDQ